MFGARSTDRRGRGTGSLLRTPHFAAEASPLLPAATGFVSVDPARQENGYARDTSGGRGGDEDAPGPWRRRREGCCRNPLCDWVVYRWREVATKVTETLRTQRFAVSCALLLIMAAAERVTFKLSVDRMAPFRSFLAETVVFMYICVCGALLVYKLAFTEDVTRAMWTFPQAKVAMIAAVDALHLFLMFVAGADISPAQTVLLLQLQVPLVTLVSGASKCQFQAFARHHVLGSLGVLVSVVLAALSPLCFLSGVRLSAEAGLALFYSIITYVLASIPAAASTVLKEKAMIEFGKPMEPMLINVMLGGYQMFFALLLSPLAFRLQGLGHPASAFPWDRLEETTRDGLHCWLLSQDPPEDRYVFDTKCNGAIFIILGYALAVLSLPSVAAAVLCSSNVKSVYRVVIAATFLSVAVLVIVLGGSGGLLSTSMQPLEVASLVVLILSLLLYHQQQDPDTEIITQYDHVAPQTA